MIIDVIQSAPWWAYPDLAVLLLLYLSRSIAARHQDSHERAHVLATVQSRMA
ncbi:MAG: hypothetical protein MI923_29870 [Phycisphaerales bacterium]|nr:hypothetical protein [Phycisphaerales bacterium]